MLQAVQAGLSTGFVPSSVDIHNTDRFLWPRKIVLKQIEGSRSEDCSPQLLVTTDGSSAEMNSVLSAQVRLCKSLTDLGAESPGELALKGGL